MKFNLVNEDKLQIIISKDDMEKRNLHKMDLSPRNPESQKLFYEILQEAKEVCGFDVGQNAQLMIEAYPMTGESMLLTVTKLNNKLKELQSRLPFDLGDLGGIGQALMEELGLQLDEMQGEPEEDLPEIDTEEAVYRFAALEDVIQAAHLLKPAYEAGSQLLRYNDAYYLVFEDRAWLDDSGLAVLSEYGDKVPTVSEFFAEHGQMVMAERAVEILASL